MEIKAASDAVDIEDLAGQVQRGATAAFLPAEVDVIEADAAGRAELLIYWGGWTSRCNDKRPLNAAMPQVRGSINTLKGAGFLPIARSMAPPNSLTS